MAGGRIPLPGLHGCRRSISPLRKKRVDTSHAPGRYNMRVGRIPTQLRERWQVGASLCWLRRTSVQKNREMCQERHEGTTLWYWIHEPSPEKKRKSDLFRTLLLCCFFGEESQAMQRPSLRSRKRSSQERHMPFACLRHL